MKRIVIALAGLALTLASCKTNLEGLNEVKTPFRGNRYESNGTWARAVASGESINLETSKDKALLSAKQRLAASVETQIKNLSENYKGERQAGNTVDDFNERFQQLTREVMSQLLVEVQTIDERVFQDKQKHYITWVALEAKYKIIYKKLKEQALRRPGLSEKDKQQIADLIDAAIREKED